MGSSIRAGPAPWFYRPPARSDGLRVRSRAELAEKAGGLPGPADRAKPDALGLLPDPAGHDDSRRSPGSAASWWGRGRSLVARNDQLDVRWTGQSQLEDLHAVQPGRAWRDWDRRKWACRFPAAPNRRSTSRRSEGSVHLQPPGHPRAASGPCKQVLITTDDEHVSNRRLGAGHTGR